MPKPTQIDETNITIETITIKQAHKLAHAAGKKVSIATITTWVDKNGLGHQPGGNGGVWYVFKEKFIKFIQGQ